MHAATFLSKHLRGGEKRTAMSSKSAWATQLESVKEEELGRRRGGKEGREEEEEERGEKRRCK